MRTFEIYLVFTIIALGTLLSTCSGFEINKFLSEMISLHNTTRALHNAGALSIDFLMSDDAMKCLKAMYFDEFPNDGKSACGENYHYTFYASESGKKETATKIFSSWYIQGVGYDYTVEPTDNTAFTQIVWKNTTKLGLAVVQENGKNFVIAVYDPPGNISGKFIENVSPPNTIGNSSMSW